MRDLSIDCLKGFAIFLVVVGHLLQGSLVDFDHNFLYRLIYSFHMPLFFFLSGYVAFLSKPVNINIIYRRFLSLVVPFLTWAILTFYLKDNSKMGLFVYLSDIIYNPDKGLWFLWVLFFCFLTMFLALKTRVAPEVSLLIASLLLIGIGFLVYRNVFGLKLLGREFLFFAMGYVSHKHRSRFLSICEKYWAFTFIFFFAGVLFWMRTTPPTFYKSQALSAEVTFIYNTSVAILAVISFFSIFQLVAKTSLASALVFVGKRSLAVYAIHFFFLSYITVYLANTVFFYLIIAGYAITLIAACLLMDTIISRNYILSLLLLGKFKRHGYPTNLNNPITPTN